MAIEGSEYHRDMFRVFVSFDLSLSDNAEFILGFFFQNGVDVVYESIGGEIFDICVNR